MFEEDEVHASVWKSTEGEKNKTCTVVHNFMFSEVSKAACNVFIYVFISLQ